MFRARLRSSDSHFGLTLITGHLDLGLEASFCHVFCAFSLNEKAILDLG
jgi:hypothetical protein